MNGLTPFLIGLFSSLHCIAMCGPLCVVLCQRRPQLDQVLALNLGRVLSYTVLGALFAGVVQGAGLAFNPVPFGFVLRTAVGVMLVLFAINVLLGGRLSWRLSFGLPLWRKLNAFMQQLDAWPGYTGRVLKGMIWGLLPCGLLYALLLLAAATGDWGRGAVSMLAFGLGTLPGLLITQQLHRRIQHSAWFVSARSVAAVFIGAVGLWAVVSPWIAHGFIPENRLFTELGQVLDLCLP